MSTPKDHFQQTMRLRARERWVLLLGGDLFFATLALGISLYIWASGDQWLDLSLEFLRVRTPIWFFFLPVAWILLLLELYDARKAGSWQETTRGVGMSVTVGLGLYLLVYFSSPPQSLPRVGIAWYFFLVSAFTLVWRWFYIRIFSRPDFRRRVLIVGAGETGRGLLRILQSINPSPYEMIGFVDDDASKSEREIDGFPVIGSSKNLTELITENNISELIIAISGEILSDMFQVLLDLQQMGVEITRMPVVYEELMHRLPIEHLESDWILRSFVDQVRISGIHELVKRLVDIIGGLLGLIVFLVFLPLIAIAILIESGTPVLFFQTRVGRGGRDYKVIKFRTMVQDAEENGMPHWAPEMQKKINRVGFILRKTHLDELPQFLNVLKGDMSLVGPRPERPELVAWFEKQVPFYRARFLVKPGITGWAQVNFGYTATLEDTATKLEYDLYYIKHRNLVLDLIILLRTFFTIYGFRGE